MRVIKEATITLKLLRLRLNLKSNLSFYNLIMAFNPLVNITL